MNRGVVAVLVWLAACTSAVAQGVSTTSPAPRLAIGVAGSVTANLHPEITGGNGVAPMLWGRIIRSVTADDVRGLVEAPT
jgi:hypothetical protein